MSEAACSFIVRGSVEGRAFGSNRDPFLRISSKQSLP
jgi:hypothetical protein